VIAVDGSAAMVEETRARGLDAKVCDLVELELDEPVDAVLSTATFHWIEDHDRLFARLHAALKPGGRLAAQCGGAGNIANVQAAIDAVDEPAFRGWAGPWNYASPGETRQRLEAAGFTDVWTWLQPWPVEPADPHEYFTTVILGSHLERLPWDERSPFVDAVLSQLDDPVRANYVRLNILARRP
jgi:trans-aconitate 2-methyltransferase